MKSSLYPPNINLIALSDVHRDDYSRLRLVCLEISGSRPRIQIPVQIFDRVEPGMVSVCVCVCVHACMRVHVRTCAFVILFVHIHACGLYIIYD